VRRTPRNGPNRQRETVAAYPSIRHLGRRSSTSDALPIGFPWEKNLMTKPKKTRVVARSTGCRCPVEGTWRRYPSVEKAEKARPRGPSEKDSPFEKGATFPPDGATRRRCGWRLIAAA